MSQAAALPIIESKWTLMGGPMRGAVQMFNHSLIVIGRSSECDIVIINDPKCSRKHAKVELTSEGFEIQAIGSSSYLKINGESVQRAILKDNDLVCCGETEILFNLVESTSSVKRESHLKAVDDQHTMTKPMASLSAQTPVAMGLVTQPNISMGVTQPYIPNVQTPHVPRANRPPQKQINTNFYILVAVIVLAGVWLFTNNVTKKKKESDIRTDDMINHDIEDAIKLQDAANALRRTSPSQPFEIQQAQEHYVKGFRDFRKGQFERALQSFQTCLALNPEHALCNRYLTLSQKKFGELVQYQMILGRKYREQNQYRACRAAFANVVAMVNDKSSAIYKEAKANFDACNAYVEGRF